MSQNLILYKNLNLSICLKNTTYYIFVKGNFFFKQEIIPFKSSAITCKPAIYYFIYVLLVLEHFGLVARFYN